MNLVFVRFFLKNFSCFFLSSHTHTYMGLEWSNGLESIFWIYKIERIYFIRVWGHGCTNLQIRYNLIRKQKEIWTPISIREMTFNERRGRWWWYWATLTNSGEWRGNGRHSGEVVNMIIGEGTEKLWMCEELIWEGG